MLKQIFIGLSRSRLSERVLLRLPFVMRFAKRFVAGYEITDLLDAAHALQAKGFRSTADHLGEGVTDKRKVRKALGDYEQLIRELSLSRIKEPSISVKLSQLGLSIDEAYALKNIRALLSKAKARDVRVEIDMEESRHTESTLRIYKKILKTYPNTAVALQAYLYRTPKDIRNLIKKGNACIRLIKGAYLEPVEIAFQDKKEVDLNYEYCLNLLFSPEAKRSGLRPLVATHDEHMVHYAQREAKRHKWKNKDYEFEMLYGIREDLARKLLGDGRVVRIYTPYGRAWYPYLMRRLAERPANVWFLLKNLL